MTQTRDCRNCNGTGKLIIPDDPPKGRAVASVNSKIVTCTVCSGSGQIGSKNQDEMPLPFGVVGLKKEDQRNLQNYFRKVNESENEVAPADRLEFPPCATPGCGHHQLQHKRVVESLEHNAPGTYTHCMALGCECNEYKAE